MVPADLKGLLPFQRRCGDMHLGGALLRGRLTAMTVELIANICAYLICGRQAFIGLKETVQRSYNLSTRNLCLCGSLSKLGRFPDVGREDRRFLGSLEVYPVKTCAKDGADRSNVLLYREKFTFVHGASLQLS